MKADASNLAAIVAGNEDLLEEILLRVPAKPLLKFKCVSKQWLTSISNPQFCRDHTRRRQISDLTPSGLLICRPYHPAYPGFKFLPLESPTQGEVVPSPEYVRIPWVSIIQSCNGLLLCSCQVSEDPLGYFIYNPTTKQLKKFSYPIRLKESLEDSYVYVYVSLAFEPENRSYYRVFFIVNSLVAETSNHSMEIHVYSSKTDSWATSHREYATRVSLVPKPFPVFCKGAIHFLGGAAVVSCLFYLDVNTEIFSSMPLPAGFDWVLSSDVKFFGESQGHLHITAFRDVDPPSGFDVFEMADDYSGWSLKYRVNLLPAITAFPELILRHSALSIIRAKKEEESMIVIVVSGAAFTCNLYNGTWKKIGHLPSGARTEMFAYQYIESLICV